MKRPNLSALLIIDLQKDYFNPELWPNSVLPAEKGRLIEAANGWVEIFRKKNRPILWMRQTFDPDMQDAFLHARNSQQPYCVEGTPGADLLVGLGIREEDPVLKKKRYSAFFGTGLEAMLQDLEITHLYLAGITTSWCIRSTATDAYQRDLNVSLCADCLAGFTRESHEQDLLAMRRLFASVVDRASMST